MHGSPGFRGGALLVLPHSTSAIKMQTPDSTCPLLLGMSWVAYTNTHCHNFRTETDLLRGLWSVARKSLPGIMTIYYLTRKSEGTQNWLPHFFLVLDGPGFTTCSNQSVSQNLWDRLIINDNFGLMEIYINSFQSLQSMQSKAPVPVFG